MDGNDFAHESRARQASDEAVYAAYTTKEVDFRYRGMNLRLALSHGLFSSAGVDAGSVFLLKTLSVLLDEDQKAGRPLPAYILDAGSGVGVLGIAAAKALEALGVDTAVRAQDRDELARVFTSRNALRNGLSPDRLAARAERLLSGPQEGRYDLILSNLPAKAGRPVLEDFFRRSSRMLAEHGRGAVVIVNTLAEAAWNWLKNAGAIVLRKETGAEHTVLIYGAAQRDGEICPAPEEDAYVRASAEHTIEGIRYTVKALHGVEDFSEPSRAVVAAAKLAGRLGPFGRVLVHECGQGHFPLFLAAAAVDSGRTAPEIVLCARNVLALQAARTNLERSGCCGIQVIPLADLGLCAEAALADGVRYDLVASFPESVPMTDRIESAWSGAGALVASGGCYLVAATSTEAARFDKKKPQQFTRIGDFKRDGFRALAYRRN